MTFFHCLLISFVGIWSEGILVEHLRLSKPLALPFGLSAGKETCKCEEKLSSRHTLERMTVYMYFYCQLNILYNGIWWLNNTHTIYLRVDTKSCLGNFLAGVSPLDAMVLILSNYITTFRFRGLQEQDVVNCYLK